MWGNTYALSPPDACGGLTIDWSISREHSGASPSRSAKGAPEVHGVGCSPDGSEHPRLIDTPPEVGHALLVHRTGAPAAAGRPPDAEDVRDSRQARDRVGIETPGNGEEQAGGTGHDRQRGEALVREMLGERSATLQPRVHQKAAGTGRNRGTQDLFRRGAAGDTEIRIPDGDDASVAGRADGRL